MKKMPKGTYACATDIGKVRLRNDDSAGIFVNPYGEVLLVVCDGIGGAQKGDYASKLALETMKVEFLSKKLRKSRYLTRRWLIRSARKANSVIFNDSLNDESFAGMGTTLSVVLISYNHLFTLTIGDSRIYSFSKQGLTQLSKEQTYVAYLVASGKMKEEEAKESSDRHVLMNALGIFPSVSMEISEHTYIGQTLLVCSDGLYNAIPEEQISAVLSTDDRTDMKVKSLIGIANAYGGQDNIAIAIWEGEK